jgi:hypothetical protein
MKSRPLVAGVLVGLLGLPLAAYAASAWRPLDTANGCHTYLAFPFATNCTWHPGQGYEIEVAFAAGAGATWHVVGGRGQSLALSKMRETLGNLWTVAADGTIWSAPTFRLPLEWTSKPLNACGTGATIPINQDNGVQVLAMGIDGSDRDVPWVVDATGTVRFWRTKFNPACWAAVPAVPGGGTITSIGVYDHPDVQRDNLPWVTRGNNVYLFDGNEWNAIDSGSGAVANNLPYVTGSDGMSLWTYDFAGTWTVDTGFDPSESGPISRLGGTALDHRRPAFLSTSNKVWITGDWFGH